MLGVSFLKSNGLILSEKENDDRVKAEECVTPVRAMSSKLKRVRVDEDSDNDDQPIKRSRADNQGSKQDPHHRASHNGRWGDGHQANNQTR